MPVVPRAGRAQISRLPGLPGGVLILGKHGGWQDATPSAHQDGDLLAEEAGRSSTPSTISTTSTTRHPADPWRLRQLTCRL